ncbi:3-deoxy-7-phosphoheptulonate synthase [Tyzzerella sp. OttesenSCG-928-J15]|nr:3-deoxy-7-phosphoheptulonate synthase [Tyzzerella sp. OttesenSCG-928-J15]
METREFDETEHSFGFERAKGYLPESKCTVIAGPCAIESYEQMDCVAAFLKKQEVKYLRGGAFKPRTSPYSFQGLKEDGLKIMGEIGKKHGLTTVSEAVDINSAILLEKYVDIIQIGARNMQNFSLLEAVGKIGKPVILKRGPAATVNEWLMSAEYIIKEGNEKVILCERGIRTFENSVRYSLDISSVAVLKQMCGLSVIVDPSHAAGKRHLVPNLALAAVAAGADGIMVEIHPEPEKALSDGMQSLGFEEFAKLGNNMENVASAVGKSLI